MRIVDTICPENEAIDVSEYSNATELCTDLLFWRVDYEGAKKAEIEAFSCIAFHFHRNKLSLTKWMLDLADSFGFEVQE